MQINLCLESTARNGEKVCCSPKTLTSCNFAVKLLTRHVKKQSKGKNHQSLKSKKHLMSKSAAQDHVKQRKRGRKDASFMAMLLGFQRFRCLVFVLFFPTLTHSLSFSPSVILIRLKWAGAWLQPVINRLTL